MGKLVPVCVALLSFFRISLGIDPPYGVHTELKNDSNGESLGSVTIDVRRFHDPADPLDPLPTKVTGSKCEFYVTVKVEIGSTAYWTAGARRIKAITLSIGGETVEIIQPLDTWTNWQDRYWLTKFVRFQTTKFANGNIEIEAKATGLVRHYSSPANPLGPEQELDTAIDCASKVTVEVYNRALTLATFADFDNGQYIVAPASAASYAARTWNGQTLATPIITSGLNHIMVPGSNPEYKHSKSELTTGGINARFAKPTVFFPFTHGEPVPWIMDSMTTDLPSSDPVQLTMQPIGTIYPAFKFRLDYLPGTQTPRPSRVPDPNIVLQYACSGTAWGTSWLRAYRLVAQPDNSNDLTPRQNTCYAGFPHIVYSRLWYQDDTDKPLSDDSQDETLDSHYLYLLQRIATGDLLVDCLKEANAKYPPRKAENGFWKAMPLQQVPNFEDEYCRLMSVYRTETELNDTTPETGYETPSGAIPSWYLTRRNPPLLIGLPL